MSFTESLDDLVLSSEDRLLGTHPSWERVRLFEIGNVLNGFAFSSKAFSKTEGADLIRIRDIVEGTTETKYSGDFDPLYLVNTGDLLVGMDGDFNRAIWRGGPALLNQRVCKIETDERFYRRRFLFHVLPGYLQAINRATSSVTVKHLSSRTLQDLPIPLPSTQEQDRIVDEIEKQFSRLDAAMEALKRVQANLKRYRTSVLKAACEGRLVLAKEPDLYPRAKVLGLLREPLANGRSPQTSNAGYRILRLTAIKNSLVNTQEWRFGILEDKQVANLSIKPEDILISRGNGSKSLVGLAGLVGIAETSSEPVMFPDTMIRVRLNKELCDPQFFVLLWNSRFVRDQIESAARTTAGIHKISQADIERFEIPLPTIEDQLRIVAAAARVRTIADHTNSSLGRLIALSARLRTSVLADAFSGKLVPQDPTDEPASVLLERIHAEPNASTAKTVARRRLQELVHV